MWVFLNQGAAAVLDRHILLLHTVGTYMALLVGWLVGCQDVLIASKYQDTQMYAYMCVAKYVLLSPFVSCVCMWPPFHHILNDNDYIGVQMCDDARRLLRRYDAQV